MSGGPSHPRHGQTGSTWLPPNIDIRLLPSEPPFSGVPVPYLDERPRSWGGVAMKSSEARAAGHLAARTVVDTISHVEHVHRSLSSRAFRLTDPISYPVRLMHDGVVTGAYATVRVAGLLTGLATVELIGATGGSSRPVGSTPRSNLALAALNATLGDELAEQGSPLAIGMAVRHSRSDVPFRRDAFALTFPKATPKLAVFLHGLGETEESWRLNADRQGRDAESTYGSRLADDLGYTPVYVRYNSGLHISENGKYLASLLDKVVAAWPVPVTELLLVGHSMGGLVTRSACHQAWERGDSWVSAVRHAFYLGSPHLGAGLEQWVSRLCSVLMGLEEGRPLASVLERRSAGIKDLRHGRVLDGRVCEGGDCAPGLIPDPPLLPWAAHYVISATVATGGFNPLGRLVGDLLVRPDSAQGHGKGRHIPFPNEHKRNFEGLHHFHLLNHPAVYRVMREWLEDAPYPESGELHSAGA